MFTIIIPYYDTNSAFRQRNLLKVIKNYKSIAPDFEILVVYQIFLFIKKTPNSV